MRKMCLVFFFLSSPMVTISQERNQQKETTWVLMNEDRSVRDTLGSRDSYFVRNDTLTWVLIAVSQSTDHCKSFSIVRRFYKMTDGVFRPFSVKTIRLYSTCTSLWNDVIYCLDVERFKLKQDVVNVTIRDSRGKKLKTKLRSDDYFEVNLKDQMDRFIGKAGCNGVRFE